MLCLSVENTIARPLGAARPANPRGAYDPRGVHDPRGVYDPRGVHDPRGVYDPRGAYDPRGGYSSNLRQETTDDRQELKGDLYDADSRADVYDARRDYRQGAQEEFWD